MTPVAADVEVAFADLLEQLDALLPTEAEAATGRRDYADVVSDLLAVLARRMTELHERRQTEMGSFLGWLQQRLGCRIEELTGKTVVREYPAHGVDRLLEVIQRNHPRATALDVSMPAEYRGHTPTGSASCRGTTGACGRSNLSCGSSS